MTTQDAKAAATSSQQLTALFHDRWIALDRQGTLNIKANETSLELSFRAENPPDDCLAACQLLAPSVDSTTAAVLDPSLKRATVRIAPYPGMACGDKVLLRWEGLDIEGLGYQHEVSRFVSEAQVGKAIVFVIKGVHVAALDGGSLELYWTLYSATQLQPMTSARLQLDVGDVRPNLLAPYVDEAVGNVLDPERITEGACITLRPYARMAEGDRVLLTWQGAADVFSDALTLEKFAVGAVLSFWVGAEHIVGQVGDEVTARYRVEPKIGEARDSDAATFVIAPLIRGLLEAPDVLEAQDGELDTVDSTDGVTVVIGNAQAQEGDLVYLKCDGDYFNHRDEREITRDSAGQPLVFIVPHRFWREHQGSTVRIAYSVERSDDDSQASAVTLLRVE